MKGFLTRSLGLSLILAGVAFPVLAQGTDSAYAPAAGIVSSKPAFSGLAVEQSGSASPSLQPPSAASEAVKTDILAIEPVTAAPLPNVSPESIGEQNSGNLGSDMWKGSDRGVAMRLLSFLSPVTSPVLNDLAARLLTTAAIPPEGEADSTPSLTSLRAEKLVLFGDAAEAWDLAKQADPKLIDAQTFHLVAENALLGGDESVCAQAPDFAKAHVGADWQEFLILCRLRAKDNQSAQVALDVFRAEDGRDSVFLNVADKNILGGSKTLPSSLTPLTPLTLALLQTANLPLPSSLFAHAEYSMASALLRLPAQQDGAKLALAENAAQRGLVKISQLEAVYRAVDFSPEALASPLTSAESGARLRALLFNASEAAKDAAAKIVLAGRFAQTAPPEFLNGAGGVLAAMLGDIKPDPAFVKEAAAVARLYMLGGKIEAAQEWLKFAEDSGLCDDDIQAFWPQFALGGIEAENAYDADFRKWLDGASKTSDEPTMRHLVEPILLFLDAAGKPVPENAWAQVLSAFSNEKKIAFPTLLFEKMRAAASAHRRAETVLLAEALASDGALSLPAALGIVHSLRQAGFENEASLFARQAIALLSKDN